MAISKFLDSKSLALQAWRIMAPLSCAAKFNPFLSFEPSCNHGQWCYNLMNVCVTRTILNPPPMQPRTLKVNTPSTMCRMPVTKTAVRRHSPCSCCRGAGGRGRCMFQATGCCCTAPVSSDEVEDMQAGFLHFIITERFKKLEEFILSLYCRSSSLGQHSTTGRLRG